MKELTSFLAAATVVFFSTAAFGNILHVTNNFDSGSGSLRQNITDALPGDEIVFDIVSQTIHLTSGPLLIDTSLSINGSVLNITIDAGDTSGVFFIINPGGGEISVNVANLRAHPESRLSYLLASRLSMRRDMQT